MDRDPSGRSTGVTVTPSARLDMLGGSNGALKTPVHRIPRVDEAECVGCNLCWLVCPVDGCITMDKIETGKPMESWEQRTSGVRA